MSSLEKRENGSAMMVMGWVLILFAFMVMFFHPAAMKLGEKRFDLIPASLATLGLLLSLIGVRIRAHNR